MKSRDDLFRLILEEESPTERINLFDSRITRPPFVPDAPDNYFNVNMYGCTNEKCLGAFPYVLCRRRMLGWRDQLIPVSCRLTTPWNVVTWTTIPARRWIPCDNFEILAKHVRGANFRAHPARFKRNDICGNVSEYADYDRISVFDSHELDCKKVWLAKMHVNFTIRVAYSAYIVSHSSSSSLSASDFSKRRWYAPCLWTSWIRRILLYAYAISRRVSKSNSIVGKIRFQTRNKSTWERIIA